MFEHILSLMRRNRECRDQVERPEKLLGSVNISVCVGVYDSDDDDDDGKDMEGRMHFALLDAALRCLWAPKWTRHDSRDRYRCNNYRCCCFTFINVMQDHRLLKWLKLFKRLHIHVVDLN